MVPNRWTAAGVASVLVGALGVPALAAFGAGEHDLKHRRSQVDDRLHSARGDLGESSARLTRAVRRLDAAQSRLDDAQAHLADTRAQLRQADAFDDLMQSRLDDAKERLAQARDELEQGRQAVGRQRDRLAGFAAQSFQSGQSRFLELRVFLKTE